MFDDVCYADCCCCPKAAWLTLVQQKMRLNFSRGAYANFYYYSTWNIEIGRTSSQLCFQLRSFFISCGFPTPPNYNPADHFVRILAIEPGKEAESQIRIEVVYCQGFGVHPDHSSSLIMLDIFINLICQFIVSL